MPAVSSIIAGGAAIAGAGSSIISGNKAAKAQKQAAQQGADVQRYMFDQSREDMAPYRDVGTGALYKLAGMYGVDTPARKPTTDWAAYVQNNPDLVADYGKQVAKGRASNLDDYGQWHYQTYGQAEGRPIDAYQTGGAPAASGSVGDYGGFTASPGYKFRLDEGIKAVERSAAARGLLGSGATMKGIQRYGEGLASSEYENYANALRSMAGIGQTSAQATGAQGIATGQGIAQSMTQAGNARASGYANTGAAVNQGISNVLGAYLGGSGGGSGGFTQPSIPWVALQQSANSGLPSWMYPGGGIGGGLNQ
jgi:hypothetical protein